MSNKVPSCPRCGYDLSGQVAACESADADSFPIRGVCSECGLSFWWRDVFRPDQYWLPGFIEHARLWLTLPAAWRTWSWAAVPPRFWGKIRLEHRPRLIRLALWLFLIFCVPFVLAGIPGVMCFWPRTRSQWHFVTTPLALSRPWTEHAWQAAPFGTGPIARFLSLFPSFFPAALALSISFPLMLACLRTTRAHARLSMAHLARAATYQLAWLAPFAIAKYIAIACFNVTHYAPTTARALPSGGIVFGWSPGWALTCLQLAIAIVRSANHQSPLWLGLISVWWGWWWWCTLSRGFRLDKPATGLDRRAVPSLLVAATLLVLNPQFLRDFL